MCPCPTLDFSLLLDESIINVPLIFINMVITQIHVLCFQAYVGLQIVLRDQKSKEGFKSQSIEIY